MRIALTMRVTQAANYHEARDSISHDWLAALTLWGFTPLLVPNRLTQPVTYLNSMAADLLILTGGEDPGESPERDQTEAALLEYATERRLPVLGVCRGLQFINRHFGGAGAMVNGHVATHHDVRFEGSFARVYGERVTVNSFHGHGIPASGLAHDLVAGGLDDAGCIEAAYHARFRVAGIMWHPERPGACSQDRELIRCLAASTGFWT